MSAEHLPPPLVAADVDLRDFAFTPMFRARLFGSAFHARATDAEWRAGVTLWLKSWDQAPAGSLPDDDVDLCRLAELGRDLKTWRKLKIGALHGWLKCSDGRLYHNVVAEGVNDAWQRKKVQRDRTEKARQARLSQRLSQSEIAGSESSVTGSVTESVTASKGQGQGQGQGQREAAASTEPVAEAAALPSEDYRPSSAETKLIAIFDEHQAKHFGERKRQFPAADDLVYAKRWHAAGLTPELAEHVFGAIFARMAGKSPPRSLKYADGAITDALAEGARPTAPPAAPVDPDAKHRAALDEALRRGKWFAGFGPGPWEECYPAKHLLANYPADQIAALKPLEGVPEIPPFLRRKGRAA